MRRAAVSLALLAAAAAVVSSSVSARPPGRGGPGGMSANPSAIVAVEVAFNRRAQERGQWTAFREYAAEDAVMFTPQPVNARAWLKGKADPAQSVKWQPGQVWTSCDGSLALSKGAWQRADGSTGYFTTIWRRNKKGELEWILDQGDTLASPLDTPDMIAGTVADCTRSRPDPASQTPPGAPSDAMPDAMVDVMLGPPGKRPDGKFQPAAAGPLVPGMTGGGASLDGTMTFRYSVDADGARTITVSLRRNGAMEQVLESRVAPPAKSG